VKDQLALQIDRNVAEKILSMTEKELDIWN